MLWERNRPSDRGSYLIPSGANMGGLGRKYVKRVVANPAILSLRSHLLITRLRYLVSLTTQNICTIEGVELHTIVCLYGDSTRARIC